MNKNSWETKKLGEVSNILMGQSPSSDFYNTEEKGLPFYQGNADFGKLHPIAKTYCTHPIRIAEAKDILISVRAPIGAINIALERCCIGRGLASIRAIKNKTIYKYIYYCLLIYKEKITSLGIGSTFKAINKNILTDLNIQIPSIDIQEQIIKELDTLSDIISKKKEQLAELDKLAQATFYDMFGDPITNEKEWDNKLWNEVLTIYNGKNQKKVENKNGEYPICGSGGIMGYADAYICPENTVIIGRKGNINKPIFMRKKFWNVDTAFGLVVNHNELNPNFLFYFCLNYNFEKHNKAVTIPSLTKTDLLKIAMPCPPLSLQTQFAKKIEIIEQQKALINKSIDDVQLLFDYTMDKYFN